MKRFSILSCTLMLAQMMTASSSEVKSKAGASVVAAYYQNWSQYRQSSGERPQYLPHLINPKILTDLYYAYAVFGYVTRSIDPANPHLTGNFAIEPTEWNDHIMLYPEVIALKEINPNLRIILSIGGFGFNDPHHEMGEHTHRLFSQMISTRENRSKFIHSAVAYAHKWGFEGVDINWEYPGDLTRGGSLDDFDNFILFLKECSEIFHAVTPHLLLTYDSPAIVPYGMPQFFRDNPRAYFQWLAKCAKYLDRINIMAFNYHGPFENIKLTGANAPLTQDTLIESRKYISETIQNYTQNGVPAEKMVLGMPVFGRSYGGVSHMTDEDNGPGKPFQGPGNAGHSTQSPGFLAYFEVGNRIAVHTLKVGNDPITNTAYGYNLSNKEWVSFDSPETIAMKAQVAKDNGLLGCMFWAVDNDEYFRDPKYPNITSGYKIFYPPIISDEELEIESSID